MSSSSSSSERKTTVLSRFFDANTLLVAGTCSKCHGENTEVKIVAVNRRFLRQVKRRKRAPCVASGRRRASLNELESASCTVCLRRELDEERPSSVKKEEISMKTEPCETLRYSKYFVQKVEGKKKEENILSFVPVWHPPKSPHNLIEEGLYADPWALLVATIFLNKTSCATARPYIEKFLRDFRDPYAVLEREPADLEKYFAAIGLRKRALQVWRMSHDFVHKSWTDVGELHGIGGYGRDAFDMFCLGRMHVEPKDRFLRIYKAWFDLLEKDEKNARLADEEENEDESEDSGFGCSPPQEGEDADATR